MTQYNFCDELTVDLAGGVLTATMNRPEKKNAFNGALRHGICDLLRAARVDDAVRTIVFTGAGGAFCSGADLTAEDRRPWPAGPADPDFAWCLDLLEMPKPTIAAIDGVAAGGGLGLALLCDIRVCSDRARLLPVWMRRAIHPDDLVTWTLPRLVGYSRALTWLYLADDIPLDEARASGLVKEVVSPDDLLPVTMALAERLAQAPAVQMALTKQAVLAGLTRSAWDAALIESWGQDKARATADFAEGIRAFRERRSPEYGAGPEREPGQD